MIVISRPGFVFSIPPNLALGATRQFTVTTEYPPLNGVTLTPYGNNLIFSPSTWVITPTSPVITVSVKAVNSHSDPLKETVIAIDYDISGTDSGQFIEPVTSYVYIGPPLPGSYDASILSGASTTFASTLMVATLATILVLVL